MKNNDRKLNKGKVKEVNKQEVAVKVENLSKKFIIPHEKINSMRGAFVGLFKKKNYEEFLALNSVSFEVKKGEFFGIIGKNGSGKSTLLKLLAGIYQPDSGKIKINGMIAPFLELGIGFNPELSGKDNVYLNAAVLGMSKNQVRDKFDEIIRFAGLERFVDQKLKNYSSGMQVRLAFAVSVFANREILLMDEVLAVGDSNFQNKCLREFEKYKKMGRTVIIVTHDVSAVRKYCDRAMLINNGDLVMIGNVDKVVDKYFDQNLSEEEKLLVKERMEKKLEEEKKRKKAEGKMRREEEKRMAFEEKKRKEEERKVLLIEKKKQEELKRKEELRKEKLRELARIVKVEILDNNGKKADIIKTGNSLEFKLYFKISEKVNDDINIGFWVENEKGVYLWGYNTEMDGFSIDYSRGVVSIFLKKVNLLKGDYFVNVAIANKKADKPFDLKLRFAKFKITTSEKESKYGGVLNLEHIWKQ